MVLGQRKGWFLVSSPDTQLEFIFEKPSKGGQYISKKIGSMFLEVETEKVKQLIHQKEEGCLTCGAIDDLLSSNTVFPGRPVIR